MANRYWVGGTGYWDASTTTHWSDSSGGAGGSSVPTSSDNVIFDSGSASDNYTVTITATANCADFTMDKPTGAGKKVTWAGSSDLNIYGSLNLSGGTAGITRTYTGILKFVATSTGKTIDVNGITFNSSIWFNGTGGGWTLSNNLDIGSGTIVYAKGNLDTNGKSVTLNIFDTSYSNARTLTLGSSTITCSSSFGNSTGTNLTVIPNTSIIIQKGGTFFGQGCTYNEVRLSGGLTKINGANTIATLLVTGAATTTDTFIIYANQIITGTLTINGNSAINRLLVKSNALGTARTITAATVSVTNADFQDITGAGAGSWDLSAITGGSGDCGGNTDITFTTADDWYWHADTGNVSDYSKWYTETNGGGSQMGSTRVPLPQDTLKFDANSFDSASQTITQNMPRIGSIDFTGATNTPTFATSTTASIFGSITLISGMTLTNSSQPYTFEGRGSYTLDSGGLKWYKPLTINAPGGTLTLKSNLVLDTNKVLTLTFGTFSAVDGVNNYNVTCGGFDSNNSNTRTLTMGSGTWELTNTTASPWVIYAGTNLSLNSGTSTIKLSGVLTSSYIFYGGVGFNYYNFWNATTGNYPVRIYYGNTFNDFKIDAGREVRFTAGTNTTVTTFTAEGTDVAPITLTSNTTSAATLTKAGSGTITVKYCDISYLTATPAGTWLAYTTDGNVDSGNNTGWTFVSGDTRRRAAFIKFF